MHTTTIEEKVQELLHEAAEEIRQYVASQVEVWQKVPYWALEAEGRGGWGDNAHIPYTHGLHGVYPGWPPYVWVELATGRIVCESEDGVTDAPDKTVVKAFMEASHQLDASKVLQHLVDRATNGKDTLNKERNDRQRDELRQRHQVPPVWTEPAKPLTWGHNGW